MDFNRRPADIIIDDSMLIYPMHTDQYRQPNERKHDYRTEPTETSRNIIPLEEVYRPWQPTMNDPLEALPLRKREKHWSYSDRPEAPPVREQYQTAFSGSQQSECSQHIAHLLNCPMCSEYFDSKIRLLYLIIAILMLLLLCFVLKH